MSLTSPLQIIYTECIYPFLNPGIKLASEEQESESREAYRTLMAERRKAAAAAAAASVSTDDKDADEAALKLDNLTIDEVLFVWIGRGEPIMEI